MSGLIGTDPETGRPGAVKYVRMIGSSEPAAMLGSMSRWIVKVTGAVRTLSELTIVGAKAREVTCVRSIDSALDSVERRSGRLARRGEAAEEVFPGGAVLVFELVDALRSQVVEALRLGGGASAVGGGPGDPERGDVGRGGGAGGRCGARARRGGRRSRGRCSRSVAGGRSAAWRCPAGSGGGPRSSRAGTRPGGGGPRPGPPGSSPSSRPAGAVWASAGTRSGLIGSGPLGKVASGSRRSRARRAGEQRGAASRRGMTWGRCVAGRGGGSTRAVNWVEPIVIRSPSRSDRGAADGAVLDPGLSAAEVDEVGARRASGRGRSGSAPRPRP